MKYVWIVFRGNMIAAGQLCDTEKAGRDSIETTLKQSRDYTEGHVYKVEDAATIAKPLCIVWSK